MTTTETMIHASLHTKYNFSESEKQKFIENEKMINDKKIHEKQLLMKQLQKQEQSCIEIHTEIYFDNNTEQPSMNKKRKIGYYKRVCKIQPRKLKEMRVNSGYNKERIQTPNALQDQYSVEKQEQVQEPHAMNEEKANTDNKLKKLRWYHSNEIAEHNSSTDCWLVIFNKIYDITSLIRENRGGLLTRPLIHYAGEDISHWFNKQTKDPITHKKNNTREVPYLPHGRYIHIPPDNPVTDWCFKYDIPWWKNINKYVIGLKTQQSRNIRMVNTLSKEENILQVCNEETLSEIESYRYMKINKHSKSYTWKYVCHGSQLLTLDMQLTLSANGIKDDQQILKDLGIKEEEEMYIPAIYLYFNDDLTLE